MAASPSRPLGYHWGVKQGLITVGHGTASQTELVRLLHDSNVTSLVDVRRYPGSRAHPHVGARRWPGGCPRRVSSTDGRNGSAVDGHCPPNRRTLWWQVPSFRAYAHHMRSAEFLDAINGVLADSMTATTAVMCSESLWWRCHRRLIADFAVLARGAGVRHLYHDGRLTDHVVAAGARLSERDFSIYDLIEPAR